MRVTDDIRRVRQLCLSLPEASEQEAWGEPAKYFVPPYVGVKGWTGIYLDALDDAGLRSHVIQSFCLIAPKKLQALVAE